MSSYPMPKMFELHSADNNQLTVYDWSLAADQTTRGTVLLVHGLGEHMGRYLHVAKYFNDWGFNVRGYDQYGHGLSSGPRGGLPSDNRMVDDLDKVIRQTRQNMRPNVPLLLVGHSMGGGIVGRYASLQPTAIDALVMSSPALNPGLNAVQKILLATLPKIAPNLCVPNGLNVNFICRDANVVNAYLADPLVHNKISTRLAKTIADTGAATIERAASWTTPTLLMYAGSDKLVNPAGSRAFAAIAPDCVTAQVFGHMFHEIFNEPDQAQVFEVLKTWLDRRFPIEI
jgi:alpha-beta hydrolase superfamily lysophospholipase